MIQVNTHEAQTKLSWLLSKVENENQKIKICRNGKPIALVVPMKSLPDPLKQHPKLMGVKIHEDPTATLGEDEWPGELKG